MVVDPFKKYGLKRCINAATCLTRLGGSIVDPRILKAMNEASSAFINIPELQQWAGREIAKATSAEAGLPTAGAVNSLILAAAACIMRGTELEKHDPLQPETWSDIIQRLPAHTEGLRTEFVVQKCNRSSYDYAVECAGGKMLEIGSESGTKIADLEEVFDVEKTAAYYYTVRNSKKGLPLDTIINVAHSHGAPVIVDAAPELRPKKILSLYPAKGADLVIYSGGKHLGGPNNTGILTGRADLIKLAHLQAYPFDGIGRAAKMSRETIVGLVEAIHIFQQRDDAAWMREMEAKARSIADRLSGINGVETGLVYEYTVEEGERMTPFAYLKLDETKTSVTLRQIHRDLKQGEPCIETLLEPAFLIPDYKDKVTFNPEYLLSGDDEVIIKRVREILTGKGM